MKINWFGLTKDKVYITADEERTPGRADIPYAIIVPTLLKANEMGLQGIKLLEITAYPNGSVNLNFIRPITFREWLRSTWNKLIEKAKVS